MKGFAVSLFVGLGGQPLHRRTSSRACSSTSSTWARRKVRGDLHMIELFQQSELQLHRPAPVGLRRVSLVIMLIGLGSLGQRRACATTSTSRAARWCRSASSSRPPSPRSGRASAAIQLGESIIQEFGDPREYIIRLPLSGRRVARSSAKQRDRRPGQPSRRSASSRSAGWSSSGPRSGAISSCQAVYAGAVRPGRHPASTSRGRFERQGRGGRHRRRLPRRDRLPGRAVADRPGVLAAGAGGAADDHRLLGQRHDRGLRPAAREPRQVLAAGQDLRRSR